MSRTYRRKNNKPYWIDERYHRDTHVYANRWARDVKEHTNMFERAYIRNSLSKIKYDINYDIINYKKYYKGLIWYYD